jgi:hypothetical protein
LLNKPDRHQGLIQHYADGKERLEIHFGRADASHLPYARGTRLVCNGSVYEDGLRATENLIWLCPNLLDELSKS